MIAAGDVLDGTYEVIQQIGSGGMSKVFLLKDVRLHKLWAAKCLMKSGDEARDRVLTDSFIGEYNLLRTLDHPALPRITNVMVLEDGTQVMVEDYVEGTSLEDLVKIDGPQPEDSAVDWARQLCDVLDYLHTRTSPVYYQDMKPANVILTPEGRLRMVDLGIARFDDESMLDAEDADLHADLEAGSAQPSLFASETIGGATGFAPAKTGAARTGAATGFSTRTGKTARLTQNTACFGTKGYAAPEQYGGGVVDERTDVYGLGATLFHLVTGSAPAAFVDGLPPVRQLNPQLSSGLEAIIAKATAAHPDNRYRSAADMYVDLTNYRQAGAASRSKLKAKMAGFGVVAVGAALCLVAGAALLIAKHSIVSNGYTDEIAAAQLAVTPEEAQAHYLAALDYNAADDAEAYLGLLAFYLEDGEFSVAEETQLMGYLLPNVDALAAGGQLSQLAYQVGLAYWFDYSVSDTPANTALMRMRQAKGWFARAAADSEFPQAAMAQRYVDIASFNNGIVAQIEKGTDAGQYAPYFADLTALVAEMAEQANPAMRLTVGELAGNAIWSYARSFRVDGVSRAQLEELQAAALKLVEGTTTANAVMDERKSAVMDVLMHDLQVIDDAFTD